VQQNKLLKMQILLVIDFLFFFFNLNVLEANTKVLAFSVDSLKFIFETKPVYLEFSKTEILLLRRVKVIHMIVLN
jgi:hypothetical protein